MCEFADAVTRILGAEEGNDFNQFVIGPDTGRTELGIHDRGYLAMTGGYLKERSRSLAAAAQAVLEEAILDLLVDAMDEAVASMHGYMGVVEASWVSDRAGLFRKEKGASHYALGALIALKEQGRAEQMAVTGNWRITKTEYKRRRAIDTLEEEVEQRLWGPEA